jgi:aminoglycoside phosphotransferase family enzyme
MSWIFLTETHAWKLKKCARTEYLDFSTPEARKRDCEIEVRLNRQLAPNVYLGVVPLTAEKNGKLQLGGKGEAVDWLVWMRRLPADRMLDTLIARRSATRSDISKLASLLTAFYGRAPRVSITGREYREELAGHLESAHKVLAGAGQSMLAELVKPLFRSQLTFLEKSADSIDGRILKGKIIEGHGDLRPEHVCLKRRPVIIDCLEFNRDLRVTDICSELTFFALECERLGAPDIGKLVLKKYVEETADSPPSALLAFYKAYHACIRAKLAVLHVKDDAVRNRTKWISKAAAYLSLATRVRTAA